MDIPGKIKYSENFRLVITGENVEIWKCENVEMREYLSIFSRFHTGMANASNNNFFISYTISINLYALKTTIIIVLIYIQMSCLVVSPLNRTQLFVCQFLFSLAFPRHAYSSSSIFFQRFGKVHAGLVKRHSTLKHICHLICQFLFRLIFFERLLSIPAHHQPR